MPNWCANLLEVNGLVLNKLAFLESLHGEIVPTMAAGTNPSVITLTKIKPYPEGNWDYDWCVEHWGTKWDIEAELINRAWEGNDNLLIRFDSAWSPPEAAFRELPTMFPDLCFSHIYAESGMNYSGSDIYIGLNRDPDDGYNTWDFPATMEGNIPSIVMAYIGMVGELD